MNDKPIIDKSISLEKHSNDDLKKIIGIVYDVIEHSTKEGQDLKDFI